MTRHRLAGALGVCGLASVLALSGCGSSSSSKASTSTASSKSATVNVLAILDTTGPTKAYGSQELIGIKAAAAYYNSIGGMDGHKVVVKAVSDNGDPATAVSVLVQQLGSDPSKYTMVYPGSEGTENSALFPVLAKYPVYAVSLDDPAGVCEKASACPNTFTDIDSGAEAEVSAALWMKQHHFTKVGILEDLSSFTQEETPAIESALTKEGISHVTVSFPATAIDVSSEMSELKSDGAQAVYAEALGPAAGYALVGRAAVSWHAPVVFDVGGSALDLTKLVPAADTKGAYETLCPCQIPGVSSPGLTKLEQFAPKNAISALPSNLAGDGWDTLVVLDHAIDGAKSLDYKALTTATEHFSTAAQDDPLYIVSARKYFTPNDHQNLDLSTSDFRIEPAGPVSGGQVHSQ